MIRILFVCLIALTIAYKLAGRVSSTSTPDNNSARSSEQLLKQQYDVPNSYPDEPPIVVDEEFSTTDSSAESLTALEYVKKYTRQVCSFSQGYMLGCSFNNRGDRDISRFRVEIRAANYKDGGTMDIEGISFGKPIKSGFKPYVMEIEGPFPAGERSYAKTKLPEGKEKDFQWLSSRQTTLAAEY